MSGIVQSNTVRTSGVIAASSAGLDWSSAVITGSTLSASANAGYWINTTSNACTITLPSSAEVGDQIVFADYARTWGTNAITIDSNGLNYQGNDDTYGISYSTSGETVSIVYSGATKGWIPMDDDEVADAPSPPVTQKAIFGYGYTGSGALSMSNLVNSSGVVAADVSGVGTARNQTAAAGYGGDKGIFGFGDNASGSEVSITNLVNNSGVIAADVSGVGTVRKAIAAASFGGAIADKAIFAFGTVADGSGTNLSNLVNNSGVVASDTTGVGTARSSLAATGYGTGLAIFAYGYSSGWVSMSNKVSISGVVASDVTGVGTARGDNAAARYGSSGQALFGYGQSGPNQNVTNKVSNTGVIASDTTGVGTARAELAAARYGGDKAIFSFGSVHKTNLVNNVGTVASDVNGVGTSRFALGASGFSYTT